MTWASSAVYSPEARSKERRYIVSRVVEEMGGKQMIMDKAQSENVLVREHALVALQKIMITNWQIV